MVACGIGDSELASYSCSERSLDGPERVFLLRCPATANVLSVYAQAADTCAEETEATILVLDGLLGGDACVLEHALPGESLFPRLSPIRPDHPYFLVIDTGSGAPEQEIGFSAHCAVDADICCPACEGTCENKECGDDGCGGECPDTCAEHEDCNNEGLCVPCRPDCAGRICGPDGCGGRCGPACPGPASCWAGNCLEELPYPHHMTSGTVVDGGRPVYGLTDYAYDARGLLVTRSTGIPNYEYDDYPPSFDDFFLQYFGYDEHGNIVSEEARLALMGTRCMRHGPRLAFSYVYGPSRGGLTVPLAQEVDYLATPTRPDERWSFTYDDKGRKILAEQDGFESVGVPDGTVDARWSYQYDEEGRVSEVVVDGVWGGHAPEATGEPVAGPSGQELAYPLSRGDLLDPGLSLGDAGGPDGRPEASWTVTYDEQGRRSTVEATTVLADGEQRVSHRTYRYEDGLLVEIGITTTDSSGAATSEGFQSFE